MSSPIVQTPVKASATLIAAFVFLFAGCDSGGSDDSSSGLSISGEVTEGVAYGKRADVEGAVVSATSVYSDGRRYEHPDTAVVRADGRFTLRIQDAADEVVLEAVGATIESRVVVAVAGGSETQSAAPMNEESTLEADVFIAARDADMDLTLARISAFVDARLAAENASSQVDVSALASVIFRGQEAEEEYVEDREVDENPREQPVSEKRVTDEEAYERQQSELDDADSAQGEADAIANFNATFSQGYVDAGLSAELNAEAAEARRSAIIKFSSSANLSSEARDALEHRADVYASIAVGAAVRASFVAAGAANATLDEVDLAVENLKSAVVAAETSAEADAAFNAFDATIKANLAAELAVPEATVDAAILATATARTALDAAVTIAGDADAVASAHKEYFGAAEAAATTALSATADAAVAAKIIAIAAAR